MMPLGLLGWGWEAIAEAVEWLAGAVGWLGHLLDPVGEILAKLWPPVLAAIAAVVLVRTVRWVLLLWRGRAPRVQISTFAWATSDSAGPEATWVTSLFREQLAALRLDALDPLPERAPGAPLVEIVEGVGQGVGRDLGAAAARLFRAAWPDSAYEVWGTLRPHDGGGGGRISVQLIERRRGNRTLLNVALEEASWEDGAREAAMAVAGALYPQVCESDRGPWTRWTRPVPRTLMSHYHAARRYEEANRLEHALAEYHAALDQDPLNPNLRLKIAMLQERLELYLDAWVTYEAIVDDSDPRAWHGPDRRVYLLALYRLSVMLSNGRVAAQWVKGSAGDVEAENKRDQERGERRAELMRSLERNPLFAQRRINFRLNELPGWGTGTASFLMTTSRAHVLLLILRTIDAEASKPSDALGVFRQQSESKERERGVEAVLRILGLRRLEELEAALRIIPPWSRRWRAWWIRRPTTLRQWLEPEFARSAVRTSKLLVRVRIAASLEIQVGERSAGTSFPNRERWTKEIREAHQKLTRRWPFPPVNPWRKTIHFLAPRRRWANRRDDAWQLHYNAACATASVLRRDSVLRAFEGEMSSGQGTTGASIAAKKPLPKRIDRKKVVNRAIAQLEEYAFRAGSDRVAAQADWVAIDDPDLRGLRDTSEFELWAGHHLPRALPKGLSSRKADVKRFTVRLVHEGACLFALAWRERAEQDKPAAAEIVDWWRVEAEVWQALANACREHLSWQERLKWLTTLQEWLHSSEREEQIDFSHEARGTAAADSMSDGLFEELEALATARPSGNGAADSSRPSVPLWVGERVLDVRKAHEAGEERADAGGRLRAKAERAEALRAAQIWTRLAEALEAELTGECEGDSGDDLRTRIDRIRHPLSMGAELEASWLKSPTGLLRAGRSRWSGRGRSRGRRRRRRGSRRSG